MTPITQESRKESRCCEKCLAKGTLNDRTQVFCSNPNCECHKVEEIKGGEEKLTTHQCIALFAKAFGDIGWRVELDYISIDTDSKTKTIFIKPLTPKVKDKVGVHSCNDLAHYDCEACNSTTEVNCSECGFEPRNGHSFECSKYVEQKFETAEVKDWVYTANLKLKDTDKVRITVGQLNKMLDRERSQAKQEAVEKIIDELESNPNPDGSISPNIQHWIESKQIQLRQSLNNHEKNKLTDICMLGITPKGTLLFKIDELVKLICTQISKAKEEAKEEAEKMKDDMEILCNARCEQATKEAVEKAQTTITKLLNEFANTPLDKRDTGWQWLLRVRESLKKGE